MCHHEADSVRANPIRIDSGSTQLGPDQGSQIDPAQAERLQAHRAAYAKRITAQAGIGLGSEIAATLAVIPRERFVGPPPWTILSPGAHVPTISDDPAVLYQDVLVSLGSAVGLNNGQPSLHAMCLNALAPKKGEHAVHVGAGTGYYTAVLAMLVGETGWVDAFEIEPGLAERACANLKKLPQVQVHCRSGAEAPLPPCDVLYVNAGATAPLAVWLDALQPHGRLLFPLEPEDEPGEMLLVTRQADGAYAAKFLCQVQFVPCAGAQDTQARTRLVAALLRGSTCKVRWLHRSGDPDESCWCAGQGWWLSTG
jgi:protein-L-isoaspartate(D-aspartate) O-methyltransferase